MKIIREGKEYELTHEELMDAYWEIESKFIEDVKEGIRDDILDKIHEYLDEDSAKQLIGNKEFLQEITDDVYKKVHSYGVDYDYAIQFAFEEVPYEFLDNKGDDADDLHMLQ